LAMIASVGMATPIEGRGRPASSLYK
jgi:hypothetical protein